MRKRFTFSKLLGNDKLMMLVSLLVATVIWVVVLTGPMNIVDRVIGTKVTVNLGNSYAGLSGLRVIGTNEAEVQVTVEGAWSVISRIDAQDLRVAPDLTAITGPGDYDLPLLVSRNSAETSYDILSITPSKVSVHCDYWQEGTIFKVECDASALKVTDPATMQVGDPVVDQSNFSNGMVTVEGPKATVSRIKRLVARVTATEPLSDNRRFEVPLTALDAEGNAVDLADCTLAELPAGLVHVTVPIWEARQITLGVAPTNAPDGFDAAAMLTVTPPSIRVLGPTAELDALQEQLKAVGTVDLRTLSADTPGVSLPLTLPSTVRGEDVPEAVTVSLNTDTAAQKVLTVTANASNVVIADGKRGTVRPTVFENLTVVGAAASVAEVTADDIVFTVQSENSGEREEALVPTVTVKGFSDVWVCLPAASEAQTVSVEFR